MGSPPAGYLRSVVYGFNDGLTANFGLVAGVIGASVEPHLVVVTGIAGALADALSMGSSGYLAAKSEAEVAARQVAIERDELRLMPDLEEKELALILEAKGLTPDNATRISRDDDARSQRALETKVQEELGIQPPSVTPLADGLVTGTATAFGAVIPLLPLPDAARRPGDMGVADDQHAGALRGRRGPQHLHRPRRLGERARHVRRRVRRRPRPATSLAALVKLMTLLRGLVGVPGRPRRVGRFRAIPRADARQRAGRPGPPVDGRLRAGPQHTADARDPARGVVVHGAARWAHMREARGAWRDEIYDDCRHLPRDRAGHRQHRRLHASCTRVGAGGAADRFVGGDARRRRGPGGSGDGTQWRSLPGSCSRRKVLRLAYQGEPGAYSEAAALVYGGPQVETVPCKSFDEVFEAVVKKRATHGVVPLENSIGGTIHRNYDLLLEHELTDHRRGGARCRPLPAGAARHEDPVT